MRRISAPFHSHGDIKAKVKAIRFIPILYAAIALFATNIYGSSLKDVTRSGGDESYDSAINQNFDRVGNELSNVMHKTSTETIHGYKYFVDPVDFGTVTADSGTITVINGSTITFSSGTITVLNSSTGTIGGLTATNATISSATITTLDSPIVGYNRPNLVWISTNAIAMSTNTSTANRSCVLFPGGDYRCVTENIASSDKYRMAFATATAQFTSGTEESGLRSGYIRTNNTWYSTYFVKSQINSANFVIVFDTITAAPQNWATLNTAYGTNGWVAAGLARNGDASGAAGGFIQFRQAGDRTAFGNTCAAGSVGAAGAGVLLANATTASSLTYTYVSGTGSKQIPDVIKIASVLGGVNVASTGLTDFRFGTTAIFGNGYSAGNMLMYGEGLIELGIMLNGPASSNFNVYLAGFQDSSLSGGF